MGWEQSDNVEKAHKKTFPKAKKADEGKGSTQ
jgi:hypothetical protein